MSRLDLCVVGGFLGAGKTSLISAATSGTRAHMAYISNDQAANLVDAASLRGMTLAVREIAGSCFCCDFEALASHARELRADGAEVVLTQAVGSCTDLVATVLRPFEEKLGEDFRVAPLSVVVDPRRIERVVFNPRRQPDLHESAAYIYVKQLEEADVIVLNKVDTIEDGRRQELVAKLEARFDDARVVCTSAITGEGVSDWLALLEAEELRSGRVLDLDYDVYAEGEAVLGWLNATGTLRAPTPRDWSRWLESFAEAMRESCLRLRAPVGHVKVLAHVAREQCVVSLTSRTGPASLHGSLPRTAGLIINARVQTAPLEFDRIVRDALRHDAAVVAYLDDIASFSPSPVPTDRVGAGGLA